MSETAGLEAKWLAVWALSGWEASFSPFPGTQRAVGILGWAAPLNPKSPER